MQPQAASRLTVYQPHATLVLPCRPARNPCQYCPAGQCPAASVYQVLRCNIQPANIIMHDDDHSLALTIAQLATVVAFALCCLGFHWFSASGWVPMLDSANLALHEAGHPLIGILSPQLAVYGGTLFQLAFPLAFIWHFYREANLVGSAAATVWLGENLLNVARYMADARAHLLPLVGSGDHDWTEIFSRWDVLAQNKLLAGLTHGIGVVIMLGACIWLYRHWHAQHLGED